MYSIYNNITLGGFRDKLFFSQFQVFVDGIIGGFSKIWAFVFADFYGGSDVIRIFCFWFIFWVCGSVENLAVIADFLGGSEIFRVSLCKIAKLDFHR